MKTALAHVASKVWDVVKPPTPEFGYFMTEEQSDAIRKWRSDVASCILLDPNERDPSGPLPEKRRRAEGATAAMASSAREAAERDSKGGGGGGKTVKAKVSRQRF